MLCEQGDTQAEDRHEAFITCGLISRVQRLQVFFEKLKLLLTGAVLHKGSTEATLTFEDFVTGEKITSKPSICPSNNAGLIGALKNLQKIVQIVFSDEYEDCFAFFIEKLEGAVRPMELMASDFREYSVELALRKIFRVIRSVKSTALVGLNIQGPENCARYVTDSFDKLADDLSDHQLMAKMKTYFRLKLSRRGYGSSVVNRAEAPAPKQEKAAVKFLEPKVEKGAAAVKVCSGHFGKQLNAVRKDGRTYTCGFGKDCTFTYMLVAGKSNQKLNEIASGMPSPLKQDLKLS